MLLGACTRKWACACILNKLIATYINIGTPTIFTFSSDMDASVKVDCHAGALKGGFCCLAYICETAHLYSNQNLTLRLLV